MKCSFVAVALMSALIAPALATFLSGPSNTLVYLGQPVVLECRVTPASIGDVRIQWREFGTRQEGNQITDGSTLLPDHPNSGRYQLDTSQPGRFDLIIFQTNVADGTYYACDDVYAQPPETVRMGAQVVVLVSDPVCTTTMPPSSSVVLEGAQYTIECEMKFGASILVEPLMTWTGPEPYTVLYVPSNGTVFSGVAFTVNRVQNAQLFTCKTNFTEKGFNLGESATNIPTYEHYYRSPQLIVNWAPKNMYWEPGTPDVDVGTTIVGYSDAFPPAENKWFGMDGPAAGEAWPTQAFVVTPNLVGNNRLRFRAENYINGVLQFDDLFVTVTVNPVPTTPSPGPSTTTTEPLPQTFCRDLTGKWQSTNPSATMCLSVDRTLNGVISGMFRNGTNSYYNYIYGRVQVNTWDEGGFTIVGTGAGGSVGVYSYALECNQCFGKEYMTVSVLYRSELSMETCGGPGSSFVQPEFNFVRVDDSPACK